MIVFPAFLDHDNLQKRIAEGFIVERRARGLRLLNYTAKAQYDRAWDQETRRCRGLVVTDDWQLVARPFEKFFNAGEHETLPVEPFEVFEKVDGSLIVVANAPDGLSITSRGSFDSEQAIAAARLWRERYADVIVPTGQTWCFELIAPWNRIVVDYGSREDLVFLAALDNATGRDAPAPSWPGSRARRFDLSAVDDVLARLAALGPNEEGYVLCFASGLRVKAKGEEYLRLHKLVTGCTARMIWESLSAGQPIEPLLERVPDEFGAWVRQTAGNLAQQYAEIRELTQSRHAAIMTLSTRKEQALAIADFPYRVVVFRMLDGKPYDDVIWKAIYPAAERPYRLVASDNA